MSTREAVITGIGVVSPLGINKEEFQENLISGKSGIGPVTLFDVSPYNCKLAGEVKGFNPLDYISEKIAGRTERCSQFAMAATKMAMEDAGITIEDIRPERTATAFGTTMGGVGFSFEQYNNFIKEGPLRIHPYTSSATYPNALSSNVAIAWNAQGPSKTFSSACTSSFDAISYGFDLIRKGEVELAIVGGSEAPLFPMFFSSLSVSGILSRADVRNGGTPSPFDARRDGTILGEGAGVLILEEYHRAMARDARIYAGIKGYGFSCDAYHIRAPHPETRGTRKAMQRAFLSSGVNPERIDYVQAHGAGTKIGDFLETKAIKNIFGSHAYNLKVSALKSMLGHLMGASGAVELCASLTSLSGKRISPTINYQSRDPDCDLDYVPNKARKAKVDYFMANCFGFGGKNGVLILKNMSQSI